MVRAGDKAEARQHAKKFLSPHSETQATDIRRAAGLLVFSPDTEAEPYKVSLIYCLNCDYAHPVSFEENN